MAQRLVSRRPARETTAAAGAARVSDNAKAGRSPAPAAKNRTVDFDQRIARAECLGHRPVWQARPPEGAPPAVQRSLKRWKPKEGSPVPASYQAIDAKARQVDAEVDAAYKTVVAQLKAGKPKQLPGVSDKRYSSWIASLLPSGWLPAAATGYIIEDVATEGFRTDPMVKLQDTTSMAGTRPDVVLVDAVRGKKGYLDITASDSAGHVFDKKGNWGLRAYVTESLYPSLDLSDLDNQPLTLSEDDMAKVEEWRLHRAELRWAKVERAIERSAEAFSVYQTRTIQEVERLPKYARRWIASAKTLADLKRIVARRRKKRLSLGTPSRRITRYQKDAIRYGVVVSADGETVTGLSHVAWMRRHNILHTWPQVKALYGL